jgi:hypothetical protein
VQLLLDHDELEWIREHRRERAGGHARENFLAVAKRPALAARQQL